VGVRDLVPVQLAELGQVSERLEVVASRVPVGKRPVATLAIRPGYNLMEVRLKMEDRALAILIGQARMVPFVQEIEHDRSRTKVEGHELADLRPRVASDGQFFQPAFLD